jgi:diaminopimelate epimerase
MSEQETGYVGGLPRHFLKMSGAGNDFLMFDQGVPESAELDLTIQKVCRRGTGVGADGVLFVTPTDDHEGQKAVRADYFNSDGGRARFCANGTRCAARFAGKKFYPGVSSLVVHTGWGPVPSDLEPSGNVRLRLPEPVGPGTFVTSFDSMECFLEDRAYYVMVGVPHLAVFARTGRAVGGLDVRSLGIRLRHHPELPEGANVNFLEVTGSSQLTIRSYERGVEDETLSCGSGVVASAVTAALTRNMEPPVELLTRSGIVLTVGFERSGNEAVDVTLTGDARIVFEGVLTEEVL